MKKFLFDLFPLLLFFIAFRFADIYVATGVAMAAAIGQIAWIRLRGHKIEPTHWINLTVIVLFGGATLILHDDTFIKWKPTVLYWVFAVVLLGARLLAGRNLMQRLMGDKIELPARVWQRLNDAWAGFFLLCGALNLFVAFSGHFSESQWVNFKVFGLLALMLVFVVLQSVWMSRHIQPEPRPGEPDEER